MKAQTRAGLRVGIDTGGTFTDIVSIDSQCNIKIAKVPSSPGDPAIGFVESLTALDKKYDFPIYPEITMLSHGTTIATNAIIRRTIAKVGLVTTKGFRDVLEIARATKSDVYNPFIRRPTPLVPRHLRFEVSERVDAQGRITKELDTKEIDNIVNKMKLEGIEAIAVCLLFSFYNPKHEQRIKEYIHKLFPEAHITISYEILPEIREFERMSTTVANACLMPVTDRYITNLDFEFEKLRIKSKLYIMRSNGGIMDTKLAKSQCIHTAFSGLAAGATFGAWLGRMVGHPDVITFDMGGTSTDICLIKGGRALERMEGNIGGYTVKVPMLDIHTLGAGGGSIAWIDKGGVLNVGPQSASAKPGPACYCQGGTEPTITDANLVLGVLNPDYFLGGQIRLDRSAASRAIEEKIAKPLSMDTLSAAEGIIRVANSNICRGFRVVSVEKGHHPKNFVLVPFGGAGPMHSGAIAKEIGIKRIIVPQYPGIASAMGLLVGDMQYDVVQTYFHALDDLDIDELNHIYTRFENQSYEIMHQGGIADDRTLFLRSADMSYAGQSHEINVPIPNGKIAEGEKDIILRNFFEEYEKNFGYSDKKLKVEIINLRLKTIGRVSEIHLGKIAKGKRENREAIKAHRDVYFLGASDFVNCPIYEREKLTYGNVIEGPAIIEQYDSTIVILPDQIGEIDEYNNVEIKLS